MICFRTCSPQNVQYGIPRRRLRERIAVCVPFLLRDTFSTLFQGRLSSHSHASRHRRTNKHQPPGTFEKQKGAVIAIGCKQQELTAVCAFCIFSCEVSPRTKRAPPTERSDWSVAAGASGCTALKFAGKLWLQNSPRSAAPGRSFRICITVIRCSEKTLVRVLSGLSIRPRSLVM